MHIAICDDNIVDRNRLEKLLHRESDTRIKTTGVLYIDAYGNMDALLKTPMLYDLFFIDRTIQEPFGLEAAKLLRDIGVSAPIVLCCSQIAYREANSELSGLHYIDKPFVPSDLSSMVTIGLEYLKTVVPRLEIRANDATTHYILPEEWIYAYPGEYEMCIVLQSGNTINQQGSFSAIVQMVSSYPEFCILGKKYLVNTNHITEFTKKSAVLSNGTQIPLTIKDRILLHR